MPKIKNWSVKRDSRGVKVWQHDEKSNHTVEIVSYKSQRMDKSYGWGYGFPAINGKGVPSSPKQFESREQAEEWAVNYMKSHPNGVRR